MHAHAPQHTLARVPADLSNREVSREFLRRRRSLLIVFWCGLGAVAASIGIFFAAVTLSDQPLTLAACLAPFVPFAIYAWKIVPRVWRCPSCDRRLSATSLGGGLRYWMRAPKCQHCGRQLAG
jgi:hypothetical protein